MTVPQLRYAMFVQAHALADNRRTQWFVASPCDGYTNSGLVKGQARILKRAFSFGVTRTQWSTLTSSSMAAAADRVAADLRQYQALGFDVMRPVVIDLDEDDYQKVWANKKKAVTPYKALRHVDAQLKKYGQPLIAG